MKIMHLRPLAARHLLLWLVLVAGLSGCVATPAPESQVFIVRHAEKGAGTNPALTEAGQARAETLAELLGDEGITRIFSTDTLRTRSTAQPLATRLGVPIELYDHRAPAQLAAAVRQSGQNALIVGHSNTIADLAEHFGAAPGETVREEEYDRLYVIRLAVPATSEIRRYGN